ncbi:hypothetical protein KUTeg_001890 [Tegillarca granosa]|uniref:G-protein coupled receptors family 1 profile domain-containing protein n=1 Tax=Tegillarca granosa TaxID=220873 RepID=A0ABQ9FSR9_TEGGR|nr:hypothetical protein KUTeg_001890 [Tegillarca granosa]
MDFAILYLLQAFFIIFISWLKKSTVMKIDMFVWNVMYIFVNELEEAQDNIRYKYDMFAIVGVVGNALVLYVFSNLKQKLTSTIFILTLAGTDFATCLVTIPFTIGVELADFYVGYDSVCKFYQFLVTMTVPFSAFVMVAIAVDRYLCICHPFLHVMTIKRAECIVACLCVFAVILGILSSLTSSVYMYKTETINSTNSVLYNVSKYPIINSSGFDLVYSKNDSMYYYYVNETVSEKVRTLNFSGYCQNIPVIFDQQFFDVYQKIYSAFFGITGLIVMVLYALIYKSVLARRRQRMKNVKNVCCGLWAEIPGESENTTEITTLNNEGKEVSRVGEAAEESEKLTQKNGTHKKATEKDTILKPGSLSRAKLEKFRMANIKTAFMLSIVTLVFILSFLPSWLMALRVIDMYPIVFYLYFFYNVANPVIYAFMNNAFKTQLKQLFHCS